MTRRGFTLMELLLALAIASIVITICYAILITTMQAQQDGTAECRWSRIQAAVFDILSEDIGQATVPTYVSTPSDEMIDVLPDEQPPADPKIIKDATEDPEALPASKFFIAEENPSFSDGAGISFVIAKPVFDSNTNQYYLYRVVTYYLKKDSRTSANLLYRKERIGWSGEMDDEGSSELLCDLVDDLKFEYYDGLEWTDEWIVEEKGDLPIAVRIKISYYFEQNLDGLPNTSSKAQEFYSVVRIRASRYIAPEDEDRRIREGLIEQPAVY